jgi:iron complex outermembrane receptor protein
MKSKSKLGWILLSGASFAAMGAFAPAFAQEADDGVSDEIVVTATGRTAAIQDVPIAVTAIGHETLEDAGVNNLIDLRQVTPNLRIGSGQSQTSGTSASIRGLGTGSDNPGFEAAVGIFIDGVYRARAGAAISDLADIERVEILRGPQGTLYGKNTTAGAISVVTAAPEMEFGAWAEGTVGDFSQRSARVGANMPFGDSFALRFDGTLRNRDGYITDVTNNEDINNVDRWGARIQALWDISPSASLRVILDGSASDEVCCGAVTLADTSLQTAIDAQAAGGFFIPFGLGIQLTQPGALLPADPESRQMTVSAARGFEENSDERGLSAQLDWDVGGLNITSITAARDWESVRDQDIDFTSMDRAYRDGLEVEVETFTQEFRVQGENGRLNWLVGGFFGNEKIETTDRIQYGAQAAAYVDRLASFVDLSALGATDQNGALPGTGQTIFASATCGFGVAVGDTCALDYIFGGMLLSLDPAVETALPGTAAALTAALGASGLNADLAAGDIVAGNGQQADNWNIDTNSLAFFTHNEFSLSDNMMLTAGLRWTREEKDMRANLNAVQPACDAIRGNMDSSIAAALAYRANPLLPDPQEAALNQLPTLINAAFLLSCNPAVNNTQDGNYNENYEEDAVSGTLSLAYHLNDDVMLYGGYSRGFKSGGFNIDRSGMNVLPFSSSTPTAYAQSVDAAIPLLSFAFGSQDLGFDPETVDAYELGLKSTVLGGSSTLNLAAFHQQLHDYQLNAFNGFNFITRNVPEVIAQGVELEFAARPTDALTFTAGVLYLDAYYDSTVTFSTNPASQNPDDTVLSGDPLSQSPEWTFTGSINYETQLTESLIANFYLNGRYVTDYRLQTLGRNPLTDQEAFGILDARVGFQPTEGNWEIDLFVRNLTDEYYNIGAFAVPEQSLYDSTSGVRQGVFAGFPNEPRMYGATLRARF